MNRLVNLLLMASLLAAAGARAEVEEIIFAVRQPGGGSHWYENFGYYAQDPNIKLYRSMGRLCRLNLRTGAMTVLLEDLKGAIRDPQVHYDGRKILFSYWPRRPTQNDVKLEVGLGVIQRNRTLDDHGKHILASQRGCCYSVAVYSSN